GNVAVPKKSSDFKWPTSWAFVALSVISVQVILFIVIVNVPAVIFSAVKVRFPDDKEIEPVWLPVTFSAVQIIVEFDMSILCVCAILNNELLIISNNAYMRMFFCVVFIFLIL